LKAEVARKGVTSAAYRHDGAILQESPSLVGTAGALSALLTLEPSAAGGLYAQQILGGARRAGGGVYWDNPHDLYAQEWGWFATALYADRLPDLWHTR